MGVKRQKRLPIFRQYVVERGRGSFPLKEKASVDRGGPPPSLLFNWRLQIGRRKEKVDPVKAESWGKYIYLASRRKMIEKKRKGEASFGAGCNAKVNANV